MATKPINLQRVSVAELATIGLVRDAVFVAGDYDGRHGFILKIEFKEGRKNKLAVLAKQDGTPRLFVTPQTCTKLTQTT